MKLSEELIWRGFINQSTFSDIKLLDNKKWVFYHGFDASADSQTVGNLAAMMFDKVFIRHGHKAIILAGGATSLIGDPGGKESERILQNEQTIKDNVECARKELKRIYEGQDFVLVNNLDWTKKISVLDFLRDIGKHFSMTPLLQRDYIANRLGEGGSGISYTEFSYTLLQGMDFLHLYDKYGATLQLGGADQWGNCLSGVDLIRRARGVETHVLTLPLIINKATGKKFGKSENGAIWLNEEKTSVFKFYQFWLNSPDDDVEDYLKIYSELSKIEIDTIIRQFNNDKAARLAQKTLAFEVTKTVHGIERAESIKRISDVLFGGKFEQLKPPDIKVLKTELKTIQFDPKASLNNLIISAGHATSNNEARRFINDGAVYINDVKVDLSKQTIDINDLLKGFALLRIGKNKLALVTK